MDPHDFCVYGTVKVGERGQIVIPVKARKELDIRPGDSLLIVRAPMNNSFTLIKTEVVQEMIQKMNLGLPGSSEAKGPTPASRTKG